MGGFRKRAPDADIRAMDDEELHAYAKSMADDYANGEYIARLSLANTADRDWLETHAASDPALTLTDTTLVFRTPDPKKFVRGIDRLSDAAAGV